MYIQSRTPMSKCSNSSTSNEVRVVTINHTRKKLKNIEMELSVYHFHAVSMSVNPLLLTFEC
jgi:hypothetical protein